MWRQTIFTTEYFLFIPFQSRKQRDFCTIFYILGGLKIDQTAEISIGENEFQQFVDFIAI